MTFTHDLIVIGGGPAGATAARVAALAGLRVVLIDKARFARDKLCGGGLSGRAQAYLGQYHGDLPGDLFHATHGVELRHGGTLLGENTSSPPFWMVMRRDFDTSLLRGAAQAGAEVLEGQRGFAMDLGTRPAVTLADGRCLRAPVLIGADGVNSAVAKALFGGRHDPMRIGFALEVEAPPRTGDAQDRLSIDLGAAHWGYGWAFPKPGSLTLGIGGIEGRNPDLRAALAEYAAREGVDLAALKVKGHHLPFGVPRKVPGQGQVLLAGDAAGLVDPITGEGIAWALHSGALAAQAALTPAQALQRYRAAVSPVQRELRRARILRALVFAPVLQSRVVPRLARNPAVQRRYLDLLAGRMDYADISLRSLLRVARKLLA